MTRIRGAQTQVVAGLNYRLVLALGSATGPRVVAVTIYEKLGNAGYELTDLKKAP